MVLGHPKECVFSVGFIPSFHQLSLFKVETSSIKQRNRTVARQVESEADLPSFFDHPQKRQQHDSVQTPKHKNNTMMHTSS